MLALSSLQDKVVVVSDPTAGLIEDMSVTSLLWHANGTWEYAPSGLWMIQTAMVDRENKIGPWSDPLPLNLPPGWQLIGSNRNLPLHPDRAAVVWRARRVDTGEYLWLVEGQRSDYGAYGALLNPVDTKVPYPWSSNNTKPYPLIPHARGNATIPVASSTILASVGQPPAPMVRVARHQLKQVEVAWSWATHSGETRLSPATVLAATHPTAYGYRRLRFSSVAIPEGVLGCYLYLLINGRWRRQPANLWRTDDPWNNRYLFGVHDEQEILWDTHEGPEHQGPAPGSLAWSISSPRQQAAFSNHAAILIDTDPYIYGPCIEPWLPANAPGGVKQRVYTQPGMAGSTLRQVSDVPPVGDNIPANTHPTYWPMLVVQNEEQQGTAFHGMSFQKDTSRGPGASLAVTCADWSGGQAFATKFFDCFIDLPRGTFPYESQGLHIGWECAGHTIGGHTASEWLLVRCSYSSICLEGTQTVNFRFVTTHLLGFPAQPIVIDGAAVVFSDGLYAARVDTLFSLGWVASVRAMDLFVDQVSGSLVDYNSHQVQKVTITWASVAGLDFLSRSPCTINANELVCRDWAGYRPAWNGNVLASQGILYHCAPNRIKTDFAGSGMLEKYITLAQPTQAEFQTRVPSDVPLSPQG